VGVFPNIAAINTKQVKIIANHLSLNPFKLVSNLVPISSPGML
jgi:hypothetical protein